MDNKKKIKFVPDDEFLDFSKTKVEATKVFDLDDIDLSAEDEANDFSLLSVQELEYKLKYEKMSQQEVEQIKTIIANKKK